MSEKDITLTVFKGRQTISSNITVSRRFELLIEANDKQKSIQVTLNKDGEIVVKTLDVTR